MCLGVSRKQSKWANAYLFEYRNFSNGQPVDNVETEKSRIVLYELESDWWILAVSDYNTVSSLKLIAIYSR